MLGCCAGDVHEILRRNERSNSSDGVVEVPVMAIGLKAFCENVGVLSGDGTPWLAVVNKSDLKRLLVNMEGLVFT